MSCDCRDFDQDDEEGRVIKVVTCPSCLPVGAIDYMIEDGRQLGMFSELETVGVAEEGSVPQVDSVSSVSDLEDEDETASSSDILRSIRSEDPSF